MTFGIAVIEAIKKRSLFFMVKISLSIDGVESL